MSISKNDLLSMFQQFSKLLGNPKGLELDYAPIYGGYRIVIVDQNGGEHHPFLTERLSKTEMFLTLQMFNRATQFKNNKDGLACYE